jgi:hypothetical protein
MDREKKLLGFTNILTEVEKRLGGKRRLVGYSGRIQWP